MQKQIGVTLFQYNPISTSSPTSNLEEREGLLMLWAGGYLREQILEKVSAHPLLHTVSSCSRGIGLSVLQTSPPDVRGRSVFLFRSDGGDSTSQH